MSYPEPDALLLLSPGCAHCPVVLEGLSQLVKKGELGRLEVVNILAHPEVAQEAGVRSVPWIRIGPFELDGVQSQSDLVKWARHAAQGTGISEYYSHLLETQRPHKVADAIAQTPQSLADLLKLLEEPETPMTVRIGIGVVLEDLQGNPLLIHALETLTRLAHAEEVGNRADAAHYLGLLQDNAVLVVLQGLLKDEHPDVREIASESIDQLRRE